LKHVVNEYNTEEMANLPFALKCMRPRQEREREREVRKTGRHVGECWLAIDRERNRANSGLVHSRYGNEINVLLSKASHFDEREKHYR
jgi:hypothetical protein